MAHENVLHAECRAVGVDPSRQATCRRDTDTLVCVCENFLTSFISLLSTAFDGKRQLRLSDERRSKRKRGRLGEPERATRNGSFKIVKHVHAKGERGTSEEEV